MYVILMLFLFGLIYLVWFEFWNVCFYLSICPLKQERRCGGRWGEEEDLRGDGKEKQ